MHALDKCVHSGGHLWPFLTSHNGLYGEAPCGKGNLFLGFRYKRVAISPAEVCKGSGNVSFRSAKRPKRTRLTITLFINPGKKTYFA